MISADDLEAELSFVRARAAGSIAGVFGPESVTWKVDREAAIFLGAGRALLLQLAHPWVATAIAEHSNVFADPIGRFHRTFRTTFTMVFGTLDQAVEAARRLHSRHAKITGVMPITAGPFAAGSRYFANETSALHWVHATLVETALIARDLVLPALSADEPESYYAESRVFAALFGDSAAQPATDLGGVHRLQRGNVGIRYIDRDSSRTGHCGAGPEREPTRLPGAQMVSSSHGRAAASSPAKRFRIALRRSRTTPRDKSAPLDSEHLSGPTGVAAVCWPLPRSSGAAFRKSAAEPFDPVLKQILDRAERAGLVTSLFIGERSRHR
jgi:hypothetical protein